MAPECQTSSGSSQSIKSIKWEKRRNPNAYFSQFSINEVPMPLSDSPGHLNLTFMGISFLRSTHRLRLLYYNYDRANYFENNDNTLARKSPLGKETPPEIPSTPGTKLQVWVHNLCIYFPIDEGGNDKPSKNKEKWYHILILQAKTPRINPLNT